MAGTEKQPISIDSDSSDEEPKRNRPLAGISAQPKSRAGPSFRSTTRVSTPGLSIEEEFARRSPNLAELMRKRRAEINSLSPQNSIVQKKLRLSNESSPDLEFNGKSTIPYAVRQSIESRRPAGIKEPIVHNQSAYSLGREPQLQQHKKHDVQSSKQKYLDLSSFIEDSEEDDESSSDESVRLKTLTKTLSLSSDSKKHAQHKQRRPEVSQLFREASVQNTAGVLKRHDEPSKLLSHEAQPTDKEKSKNTLTHPSQLFNPGTTPQNKVRQQSLGEAFSKVTSSAKRHQSSIPSSPVVRSSAVIQSPYMLVSPVGAKRSSPSGVKPKKLKPSRPLTGKKTINAPNSSLQKPKQIDSDLLATKFGNEQPRKDTRPFVSSKALSSTNWDELDQNCNKVLKAWQRAKSKMQSEGMPILPGIPSPARSRQVTLSQETNQQDLKHRQRSPPQSPLLQRTKVNEITLPARSITPTFGASASNFIPSPVRKRNIHSGLEKTASTTPTFDQSCLAPKEKRVRWSMSEKVMIIYLYEIRKFTTVHNIDGMFGRESKSSSTSYAHWHQQLKYENHRQKLNLKRNLAALQEIMKLDLPIDRTLVNLDHFIEFGSLPDGLSLPKVLPEPRKWFEEFTSHEVKIANETLVQRESFRDIPPVLSSMVTIADDSSVKLEKPMGKLMRRQVIGPRSRSRSHSTSETTKVISQVDTTIKRYTLRSKATQPYLSVNERANLSGALSRLDADQEIKLKGTLLHRPFSRPELRTLIQFFSKTTNQPLARSIKDWQVFAALKTISSSIRSPLKLKNLAQDATLEVPSRTTKSILSFLIDVANHPFQDLQAGLRLSVNSGNPQRRNVDFTMGTVVRSMDARRTSKIKDKVLSSMGPSLSYNDLSSDVGTVAFSPTNPHIFAAGCFCPTDEYNNPKNLVIGDVNTRVMHELAYHYTARPRRDSGMESRDRMYNSLDPRLFRSVAMVEFSPDGRHLLSCGFDKQVRCFGIDNASIDDASIDYCTPTSGIALLSEMDMGGCIDLMRVSKLHGRIAIGAQQNQISILNIEADQLSRLQQFSAPDTNKDVSPAAMQWGPHSSDANLLLAGFTDKAEESFYGQIALWDMNTAQLLSLSPKGGMVFDVTWSQTNRLFAAAFKPNASGIVNKSTKSVIKVYHPLDVDSSTSPWKKLRYELECPAKDINDVVFCPYDDSYIAVGSTTGQVYVYDVRRPTDILHTYSHEEPLAQVGKGFKDLGIRFCAWKHSRHGLITGSSDGVVKEWDIYRATTDAQKDVIRLNSGVMSGAFSADFTKLIIGEVNRSITILEPFNQGRKLSEIGTFDIIATDPPSSAPISASHERSISTTIPREDKSKKCKIPLCQEIESLVQGDTNFGASGRDHGRIPANLIKAMDDTEKLARAKTRTLRCTHCRAPCWTTENDLEQAQFPLCERCGFSCFRCGERRKVRAGSTQIECACGEWTIGALGYELVKDPDHMEIDSPVRLLDQSKDYSNDTLLMAYEEHYLNKFNLKSWDRKFDCFQDLETGVRYEKSGLLRE